MQRDDDANRDDQIEFAFPPGMATGFAQRFNDRALGDDLVKSIDLQSLAELAFRLKFTYAVFDRVTPENGLGGTTILPQGVPDSLI